MNLVRVIGFLFLIFNGLMSFMFIHGAYHTGAALTAFERKGAVAYAGVFSVLTVLSVYVVVAG